MKRAILGLFLPAIAISAFTAEKPDTLPTQPLHEVVVTGSNHAERPNLLPYTITSLSHARLEATGSTQLLSAISGMVPSLFVTERNVLGFGVSNGGSGHIKMRGVGGDRASAVLMMVDGQPQFAGLYSHHVADFYQTETVDHIEVLRGPASVLYGSNAMAGVINVITKSPAERGVRTTLTSQYGSHNTWLSQITNTVRCGGFSSMVSAGYNRTDGLVKDFDFNQASAYAKLGYEFSPAWRATVDYSFMTFNGNDPIYPALNGRQGIYTQKVIRGEASATAYNSYNKTNGAIRAYYSYGNHFIHDPNYFHSLDDRLGLIAYQNFRPWQGASATLGFDFDRYTGKIPISGGKDHSQAPLATLERKAITEYSPYITYQQTLLHEMLVLNAGLRMANSNLFATQWVPQAGIVYAPAPGLTLKASLAKGYRNPSFRELYLYKFANPNLQPERMMNYEVSVSKYFSRYFSADITVYYAKGSNLIQQTAILNDNTGAFINKGIELSARSHPIKSLTLWATYSYLHTSLRNLTGAPRHQYYLGIGWEAFKGFRADAELKGAGHLYVADDVAIQTFATLNLRLSYQLIKQLQLFTNLDNLTDTKYVINKGYPMPGFTISAGLKLTL